MKTQRTTYIPGVSSYATYTKSLEEWASDLLVGKTIKSLTASFKDGGDIEHWTMKLSDGTSVILKASYSDSSVELEVE